MTLPAENQQTVEALAAAIEHWVREQTDRLSTPQSRTDAKIAGRAALRDLVAQAVTAREALEAIAAEDDLVLSNSSAFSIHAFRRCQETARFALARLDGVAAGKEPA